jgi:hypothetical protein
MEFTRALSSSPLRADTEARRVWGVVIRSLDPGQDRTISEADLERIDTYNTFFRHATVVAMAEQYVKHFRAMDANHDYTPGVGAIVQSVVNDGEAAHGFPAWSWIVGSEATPEELAKVERGEHQSYSMTTREERVPMTLTIKETGQRIDVEEVVNPVCQYVSYVSRGANKSQVVIREDESMKKTIWQRAKDKILEAIETVSTNRDYTMDPFDFAEKWDGGTKSGFYSALSLYENSLTSIMGCSEKDKWKRVKSTSSAFQAALQPIVESLGANAMREENKTADEAVTKMISATGQDVPVTRNEVSEMTPEELKSIQDGMKALIEPITARMDADEKKRAETPPKVEEKETQKKTEEPVDDLAKLRAEKAETERQLTELKAQRLATPHTIVRDPSGDSRPGYRSVLRMTAREMEVARQLGIDTPSEIDVTGCLVRRESIERAMSSATRAAFTTADLALGGALPQDVNKAFWVKAIAKQKLMPLVNVQFVASNAKRVDILDFGSRKLRKGAEGIGIGGTSKPTPSNVAITLQQAVVDWMLTKESINWNIEQGQIESTILNGMSTLFGRDLEDLGSAGDTASGTAFLQFDDGWKKLAAAGCQDVNGAPINAGALCEEHLTTAMESMPDQYFDMEEGTPLRWIMSSRNHLRWKKCVTDRGDLAATMALMGDPKISKPYNIPIVTPIAWPNDIILLADPKNLIMAIGGTVEYETTTQGISLVSSGQAYYKLSQYVDWQILDKVAIVRLYGMV